MQDYHCTMCQRWLLDNLRCVELCRHVNCHIVCEIPAFTRKFMLTYIHAYCTHAHTFNVMVSSSDLRIWTQSSLAPSTSNSNTSTSSPASLVVRTTPSTSQWPGNVAVPQFLDIICKEVRHQLAAQSSCTPSTPSPLTPTPTSSVPILPVVASSADSGMALLLCMGACCHNVHGCLSS